MDPSVDHPTNAGAEEGLGTAQTRSRPGSLQTAKLAGRETSSRVPSGLMLVDLGVSGSASRVRLPVERSSSTTPSFSHHAIRSPEGDSELGAFNNAPPNGSSRTSLGLSTSQTRRRSLERLSLIHI